MAVPPVDLGIEGLGPAQQIGRGGFGTVYRARQESLNRDVAIKVLPAETIDSGEWEQFERERRTMGAVSSHDGIVTVFDSGTTPDGRPYLVMEYLDDGSVGDLLRTSGPLTTERALRVGIAVARSLDVIHVQGVLHRDVKPDNIMLATTGEIRLTDFGIARMAASATSQTRELAVSVGYAAAEILSGEPASVASDVFALGATVYAMLSGASPFRRLETDSIAVIVQRAIEVDAPDLRQLGIASSVAAVVERAMARFPADRYESAQALADALEEQLATAHDHAPREPPRRRNPYRGLLSFDENDAGNFFGREAFIGRLATRLSSEGFIALVGPSGCGKSSILAAGLLPAIRTGSIPGSDAWAVYHMRPGADPWRSLIGAVSTTPEAAIATAELADPTTVDEILAAAAPYGVVNLLIVDQIEELYTLAAPRDARRFLAELAEVIHAERLRLVLGARADYYDHLLADPHIGRLLATGTMPVPPMGRDELSRAVLGPADKVATAVDPDLLPPLLDDVAGEPGALPLLQFVLTEMWIAEPTRLTLEEYHKVGGLSGALAQRARTTYESLDPSQQEAVREVMLRLVALGEGSRDTRRRALRADLASLHPQANRVIDLFAEHRLLALDRDQLTGKATVDLAHERLLDSWDQFATWVDNARSDLERAAAIRRMTGEWQQANGEPAFLMNSGQVARYEEWRPTATISFTRDEREFIEASIARRDAVRMFDRGNELERERLQRTARKRLQMVAAALAVGMVVAVVLGLIALGQSREASTRRDAAEQQRDQAAQLQATAEAERAEAERLAAEVESNLERLSAEQLVQDSLDVRANDSQLAVLLGVEAILAADQLGLFLEPSITALHLALHERRVSFPERATAAVIAAPEGPRGTFRVTVGTLLTLAEDSVDRSLTAAECSDYLDAPCPTGAAHDRLSHTAISIYGLELGGGVEFIGADPSAAFLTDQMWNDGLSIAPHAEAIRTDLLGILVGGLIRVDLFPGGALGESRADCTPEFIDGLGRLDIVVFQYVSRDRCLQSLGDLPPLGSRVKVQQLPSQSPPTLIDLVSRDGEPWAVWAQLEPWGVWYREDVLAEIGAQAPSTWIELVAAAAALRAADLEPWCLDPSNLQGQLSVATLVESRVLALGGIDLFDAWVDGEISLTDGTIIEAHREVEAMLFTELRAGSPSNAVAAMVDETPACVMGIATPTWAQGANRKQSEPADLGVLALPTVSGDEPQPVLVDGSIGVMVTDRPESRGNLDHVLRADYGRGAAASSAVTTLSANLRLDPTEYLDPDSATLAQALQDSGNEDLTRLRFFAEHPELFGSYMDGILRWLDGSIDLESMLSDVQAAWDEI